jgi:flagellar M-ring protein FliF
MRLLTVRFTPKGAGSAAHWPAAAAPPNRPPWPAAKEAKEAAGKAPPRCRARRTGHAAAAPALPGRPSQDAGGAAAGKLRFAAAGSAVDVMVDHLKVLAAKEPERVAEVVKQWMQKNGRSE